MSKNLNITKIKKSNQIYSEKIEVKFDFDNEHVVTIYPYFKPEKSVELLKDFGEYIKLSEDEGIEINDDMFVDLVMAFIIHKFSSLKLPDYKKPKLFTQAFTALINSKYYPQICKEFPQESIEEVFERIYEQFEASAKIQRHVNQTKEIIKDLPLENKDVLLKENKHLQ